MAQKSATTTPLRSKFEFLIENITNLTTEKRQQFLMHGANNEMDGVAKLRVPVWMAVEVIKANMDKVEYKFDPKLLVSSRKTKPKTRFTDGELNEAKPFAIYKRETGQSVVLINDLAKPESPWLIGRPDGVLVNKKRQIKKILEVKTPGKKSPLMSRIDLNSKKMRLEPEKNSKDFIQVQLYMFLANCHHGEVLYYFDDDTIVRAFVELDLALVATWEPILFAFYFYKMLPVIMAHAAPPHPPAVTAVVKQSRKKSKKSRN